jgi:Type IV leader peptidase family
VTGALAGVPVSGIAYAVPAAGRIRLPAGWCYGMAAPRLARVAIALVAGATAAFVVSTIDNAVMVPALWLIAVLGPGIAVIDIRRQRLPHALTGVIWAVAITCFSIDAFINGDAADLAQAGVAAAATAGLFLALALLLPGQLGLGDVNLVGALTFTLGWIGPRTAVTGLAAGLAIQAVVGLTALAMVRKARHHMAMGPALLTGWLLAVSSVSLG